MNRECPCGRSFTVPSYSKKQEYCDWSCYIRFRAPQKASGEAKERKQARARSMANARAARIVPGTGWKQLEQGTCIACQSWGWLYEPESDPGRECCGKCAMRWQFEANLAAAYAA